ncbi:MAG: hypothetical protein ABIM89_02390 [Mycobacteriales bacterium]
MRSDLQREPLPSEVLDLLARLEADRRAKLEPALTRAVNACGCTSGAVALIAGMVAAIGWWLAERGDRIVMWPEAGIAFGVVLGVTLLAKGAAILTGKLWYAATVRSLRRRLPAAARVVT